jgi:hypothetical protein
VGGLVRWFLIKAVTCEPLALSGWFDLFANSEVVVECVCPHWTVMLIVVVSVGAVDRDGGSLVAGGAVIAAVPSR